MLGVKLRLTIFRIGLILGLVLIIFAASLFWRKHAGIILLHVFADTDCACGDYQEEVSGINVLNPLRDRQPEKAAETFFQEAIQGRCSVHYDADLCQYFEHVAPVKAWKLVNARAKDNGIDLFYKLDSSRDLPNKAWTGEGYVHVSRVAGDWRVSSYDAYF
jgi:hypothetical protein